MRFVDLLLTIPVIAIAACRCTLGGGDWWLLAFILAAVLWTSTARIIRGEFLSLREIVRRSGEGDRAKDRRIIFKHMSPTWSAGGCVGHVVVVMATALSYLGLALKRPDTLLGLLVSGFQRSFQTRPWLFRSRAVADRLIAEPPSAMDCATPSTEADPVRRPDDI